MAKLKVDARTHITLWIFVAISVALFFLGKQISQTSIQSFIENTGVWAPIAYILIHQASYVFAPISGYPFLIVGFFLFGKTTIFYNFIVAIIGSSINFFIAKRWGRPIVKKFVGDQSLGEIDKLSAEYGLGMLFVLRLFLIGLSDFISYGYGLTPIKFSTFILISTAAMVPGHTLWYVIALKTGNIEHFLSLSVVLTFAASGIFFAGHYLLKNFGKIKR